MTEKKHTVKRKLLHAGGWQVVKRVAKTVPFGGTAVAVVLVGSDIRAKGVVYGLLNSGIDAIPVVGLAKNAVELVRGDFFPDRHSAAKKKKGK
jgi:hypothetical protein